MSSSAASTGRIENIVGEARVELASGLEPGLESEPTLDPKLDLPLDPSSASMLDSRPDPVSDSTAGLTPGLSPASSVDSAGAVSGGTVGAPSDASGVPTDSAPTDTEPPDAKTQSHEQEQSERAATHPQQSERPQQAAHPKQAELSQQQKAERLRRRLRLWAFAACALIVCALFASIGIFAWDRWLRYDDAADIQGSWTAVGTQITIEIDEDSIQITEDVAYEYSLNTSDKTITFTFGDMSGSGVYSFSEDRNTLIIDEQASVDIVADFLAFYHLDTLFGLDEEDTSQSSDADAVDDNEASDDSGETSSSDEGALSLTLERVS